MNTLGRYVIHSVFVLTFLCPVGQGFSQTPLSAVIKELDASNFPEIRLVFKIVQNDPNETSFDIMGYSIQENGVMQVPTGGGCDDTAFFNPSSIMLCLDRSGSMVEAWSKVQTSAKNFVDSASNFDEFALYSFGGEGVTPASTFCIYKSIVFEMYWTSSKTDVRTNIDNIAPPCGNTPLWETVMTAAGDFTGRTKRRVIVVLTDGRDSYNAYTYLDAANAANAENITVYTIGLGTSIDATSLAAIAQATNGKYYLAPTVMALDEIYTGISQELLPSGECEISYISPLDCFDGSDVAIDFSIETNVGTLNASTSYTLPFDSTTFTYVNVKADRDYVVDAGKDIQIPLTLTRVSDNRTSGTYEIDIDYNNRILDLRDVSTTALTEGYTTSFTPTATGATITLTGSPALSATGDIALLTFHAISTPKSGTSELAISEPRIGIPCSQTSASNGFLTVSGYCERVLIPSGESGIQTKLLANSPNPFNPGTTIAFTIGKAGYTTVQVFDEKGKNVGTLVNESLEPGEYTRYFDAENLPNGPYYVHLENNGDSSVRRIVLLK